MSDKQAIPLILGGHSFIAQLGNEPRVGFEEQLKIVSECLDCGITTFDTTYQPERVALGKVLKELGRRDEAKIIAWNFFRDFDDAGDVGPADYYQPGHLGVMLEQLQTDFIDMLVVHRIGESVENERQEKLAFGWQDEGMVGELGVWHPGVRPSEEYEEYGRYGFMVRPRNVARAGEGVEAFTAAKGIGWQTFACSPFVRGWNLDKMVGNAMAKTGNSEMEVRGKIADMMLRYSLYGEGVDKLIVAIRQAKWVGVNLESVKRGPLGEEEERWLLEMRPEQGS